MSIYNEVLSHELSKELYDLGIKSDSIFFWGDNPMEDYPDETPETVLYYRTDDNPVDHYCFYYNCNYEIFEDMIPAPTLREFLHDLRSNPDIPVGLLNKIRAHFNKGESSE